VEDVDLEARDVMGAGPVANPGRDDHRHPRAHAPEVTGEIELELPFDHDGDLLLFVGVEGGHGVGGVPDEAGHELFAHHRAEHQVGDELHGGDVPVDLDVAPPVAPCARSGSIEKYRSASVIGPYP
jgi:hypothetical protein